MQTQVIKKNKTEILNPVPFFMYICKKNKQWIQSQKRLSFLEPAG